MIRGTLIEGRYEIERAVGAGGMGVVFRAIDRLEGGPVAVKLLLGDDPTEVERFEREGKILAELRHPGIVRYITRGVRPSGEHYLVMEWLDGEDLGQRLARAKLTPAESLQVIRGAAAALAVAHARGLMHRDVKPGNVFLLGGSVEHVCVLDFGIARLLDEIAPLTQAGMIVGTPGYVAPEQALGAPVQDPRADVFALGCVLFECLTGRRAFEGVNFMAVLAKILLQEIPPLRSLRADLPESLELLVTSMMARDPARRLTDAAAVVAAIDALEGLDRASPPPVSHILAPAEPTHAGRPGPPRRADHERAAHRHRGPGEPARSLDGGLSPHRPCRRRGDRRPAGGGAGRAGRRAARDRASRGAPRRPRRRRDAGDDLGRGERRRSRGARVPLRDGAAQCASPSSGVVAVTGRGVVSAHVVEGGVIDRGVHALHAAPPGAVQLDAATAEMLEERFAVDEAHVLHGEHLRREAAPLLLGKATPFVGRGRDLAILEAMFSGCLEDGTASAVLVMGEAGTGKSRLVHELLARIRRRGNAVEVIAGRADSLGESSPFGVLGDAIRARGRASATASPSRSGGASSGPASAGASRVRLWRGPAPSSGRWRVRRSPTARRTPQRGAAQRAGHGRHDARRLGGVARRRVCRPARGAAPRRPALGRRGHRCA